MSPCGHLQTSRTQCDIGALSVLKMCGSKADTRRPPAAAVLSPPLSTRLVLEPGPSSLGTEGGRVREAELQEGPSSLKASCWEGH